MIVTVSSRTSRKIRTVSQAYGPARLFWKTNESSRRTNKRIMVIDTQRVTGRNVRFGSDLKLWRSVAAESLTFDFRENSHFTDIVRIITRHTCGWIGYIGAMRGDPISVVNTTCASKAFRINSFLIDS